MQEICEPEKINISAFTYYLVKDYVDVEYRGKINIKGKGDVDMYYILKLKMI